MLETLLHFSIKNRTLIVILTIAVAILGIFQLQKLPIDAVPDITNNQVQINALAPSLSPFEVEQQVTFPMENALAGIRGLQYTRSISRNGFSQVTAVFDDGVDIYFARQQVGERLREASGSLPPGVETTMGPIATGLGEVYMYTVEYEHPHGKGATVMEGSVGWQTDGSYLSPEGRRLKSEVELASYLREVQDWIIRIQLKGVKGVAGVDAIGGYVKQYHVQPDPMKLVSYGLTFGDVIEALEKNNISTGAGYVEHKGESYLVRATGRIKSIEEIEGIVIGTRGGVPIYVRDIVRADGSGVGIGRELRTGSASENGEDVVVGTAIMLIGENSRTVAAAVDAKMTDIRRSLPAGIKAKTVLNRTKLVDATIHTVQKNLIEGAILVIIVLLLLLGNWRAALICASAIPLAMLMTATGMVQNGVSGNLMSLGAIDFGLIVDGAVIIVENCLRRLAEKQHKEERLLTLQERLHEVLIASKEMIQPSVFGQAIIITVYFPILALTGVEGKMFHPMAMTVIFALIGAFILSLTFIPAMVALCIRGKVTEKDMFLIRWVKTLYEPVLMWSMRFRYLVVLLAVLSFVSSAALFTRLGQEFVPTLDEKDIAMHAMRIASTSLSQSQKMQYDVERAVATFPEVAFTFSKTGTAELASDPMPPNVSDTFIILKNKSEWRSEAELDSLISAMTESIQNADAHADEGHDEHGEEDGGSSQTHKGKIIKLLQLVVGQVPGNNLEFTQPIQMRFNELISGVRGDVAIKVYGDDFPSMQRSAASVLATLQSVRGAEDAKVEQTEGLPVMTVEPDRPALARYGLSVSDVQDVVAVAMGGRDAGLVFEGDRRFDLVVRLPDDLRGKIDILERLMIPLPRGDGEEPKMPVQVASVDAGTGMLQMQNEMGFVPLGAVANVEIAEGVNQISRENGKRRIVVQCNVRGRDLGSFVAEAQQKMNQVNLPAGQWLVWGGQYENLVAAKERLTFVVPVCFLMIFFLLFSTFKSVKYALLVFAAVPLGLTGGIVALWLRGMPFSISAAVGFIALSGVAVLNGLVMVSFINQLRREGMSRDAAITRGSLVRVRPVLMTAMVASLGFVPMALATGTGSEVQRPLATVVIGGLISSTLLTLVVLPALYRMFTGAGGNGLPGPRAEAWELDESNQSADALPAMANNHGAGSTSHDVYTTDPSS
ncbi:MAG: CusA/CzcA family heavy metal efflux RND transporter [Phycisphaeraceae bacterium]|nr:CusA/CzcA family heavy metal efflux RND transporter [Phycisphaeraceae bacterium]MCB9848817.1 CusA/CzcA family heavy metal efflux RND transporter [Phycisphaeraceae bacterium]